MNGNYLQIMTDLPHIPRELRGVLPPHFWPTHRPKPPVKLAHVRIPVPPPPAPEPVPVPAPEPVPVPAPEPEPEPESSIIVVEPKPPKQPTEINAAAHAAATQKAEESPALSPAVLWDGVFDGWSGYTKLNHAIVHRISNHLYVQVRHALRCGGRNGDLDPRIKSYQETKINAASPYVRAFGPDVREMPSADRRRIVFTMMETEVVHPEMVSLINQFDECWAPTKWGIDAFRRSGVRIPFFQVPLGVDSLVYRPIKGMTLPPCELVSTYRAGTVEVPRGFLFLSVGLPSIRKGFDVLLDAFEMVFGNVDDVALVCAVTHSSRVDMQCRSMNSKVYFLHGSYDEHGMSKIYNGCNAYVSASRGEGWNLPLVEAAACGLPVIVPRHTSHPEVGGEHAFMFNCEGVGELAGAEKISRWYQGMPFPILGKKSTKELAELLEFVASGNIEVKERGANLHKWVVSNWSWDATASTVTRRLLEYQP